MVRLACLLLKEPQKKVTRDSSDTSQSNKVRFSSLFSGNANVVFAQNNQTTRSCTPEEAADIET